MVAHSLSFASGLSNKNSWLGDAICIAPLQAMGVLQRILLKPCCAFGDKGGDKDLRADIGIHRFVAMHRLNGTLGNVFQHFW